MILREFEPPGFGWCPIMQQNVSFGEQAVQQITTGRACQVQGYAALVSIEVEKQTTPFGMGHIIREWPVSPDGITEDGGLDLEYLGSKVSQDFPTGCGGDRGTAFEDA
jgi:hypothetical protein